MKLFKDELLKEEVTDLSLGEVIAGESKEFTFFMQNNSSVEIVDIKMAFGSPEVVLVESPARLLSKAVGKVVLRWSPSIAYKSGLNTEYNITGFELYKP